MNEKILSIEEVENIEPTKADSYESCDGYKVVTDKQEIFVLISNGQSCCENWGYLSSNDDIKEFIGAQLNSLTLTDTALKTVDPELYLDEGQIQFVNFDTSKGLLQLAVYNAHNGYYGHDIFIRSKQLEYNSTL